MCKDIRKLAVAAGLGAGSQRVREQFPKELSAARQSAARKRSCLVVITDADNLTTAERHKKLMDIVVEQGLSALTPNDPICLLIPKWEIENWLRYLLEQAGDETRAKPPTYDVKAAARLFRDRRGAPALPSELPSLTLGRAAFAKAFA